MEIRVGYRDYIPGYIEGSLDGHFVGCATNISMRFPDSASIFTAESFKPWNKLKILLSPYLLFLHIHFRVSTHYSIWSWNISWLGWWYESVLFSNLTITTLFFVWCPGILTLEVMKRQTLLWSYFMPRLVYSVMILNIQLTIIFFPLGKMIEMVRLQTSFILSSRSWEIGSPPTGPEQWCFIFGFGPKSHFMPHGLLFPIRSKSSFICIIPQTG